jgi:3',5'-cyclic-AMP phosphodiesterase
MLLAQISDTHVRKPGELCYGRVDTAQFLRNAVARLASLSPRPDLTLVTGDLVDGGTVAEYAHLRELLGGLPMPCRLVMGNHDDRASLREAFRDHGYLPEEGFIQYALEEHPLRILVLDTQIPKEGGGFLCEERLRWLASRLEEQPERPTVVAMHHPPYHTGHHAMDRFDLRGSAELAKVLSRFRNVHAVLCGHLHRPTQARFGGTVAMSCPSTAHQLHFGLGAAPFGFDLEPPAFQLHRWDGCSLVTHTVLVGSYPGPYPFSG